MRIDPKSLTWLKSDIHVQGHPSSVCEDRCQCIFHLWKTIFKSSSWIPAQTQNLSNYQPDPNFMRRVISRDKSRVSGYSWVVFRGGTKHLLFFSICFSPWVHLWDGQSFAVMCVWSDGDSSEFPLSCYLPARHPLPAQSALKTPEFFGHADMVFTHCGSACQRCLPLFTHRKWDLIPLEEIQHSSQRHKGTELSDLKMNCYTKICQNEIR